MVEHSYAPKWYKDLPAFSPQWGENRGFAPSSRREQQSTGLLHLIVQIPVPNQKSPTAEAVGLFVSLAHFRYCTLVYYYNP